MASGVDSDKPGRARSRLSIPTRSRLSIPTEDQPFRPIKLWAAIGVAFLALEVWALVGWISGPNFKTTPTGVTPVPTYMKAIVMAWEILALPLFGLFLWHFLIKPWRREGRIQSDGLFSLVFATIWWQDPLANYAAPYLTYNAELTNFGNWLNNIPGWVMPGAHKIAEAPLWTFPIYLYLIFGACVVGCQVMSAAKRRWPELTKIQLVGICYACFFSFDLLIEPLFMLLGIWTYTGVVKEFTIFSGHYYQFPLYEAVLFGGTWTAWTALRYFKDDKGRTIVERGVDELKVGARTKTALRYLALAGVCNLFFLGYNIAVQPFIFNADPINEDQLTRSYFMSGICGDATDYACYGPDVPFPRRDSAYVGNDGTLKNPGGANFTAPPHDR